MTFDMTAAWREATAMISANREVMLTVAGIFFLLPALLLGFSTPAIPMMVGTPEVMQAEMAAFYRSYGWLYALTFMVQIVGYLALLALLRDRRRPTVGEAISAALRGLLPAVGTVLVLAIAFTMVVIAAALLMALLGAGGAAALLGIVLMPALVWLLVRVSLWQPVIAIDRVANPIRVIGRSWALTRGNGLRLFVFYLLLFIAYIVVSIVIGLVASGLLLALGETAALIVGAIVSGLIGTVAAVIFVAVLAAVHRQLAGQPATEVRDTSA